MKYHGLDIIDLVIFVGIVIFTLFVGTVWAVPA